MFQPNQTVYYKIGPDYFKAVFLRYEGQVCILQTAEGELRMRSGRVLAEHPFKEMSKD